MNDRKIKKLLRNAGVIAFALLLSVSVSSCLDVENGNSGNISEDTGETNVTTAAVVEYSVPTIKVTGVEATAGAKSVEVNVSIHKNPGILGMDFSVSYNENVMTMTGAVSKISSDGMNFQAPAYYKNPTSFEWDSQDGKWASDGVFLTLTFDISDTATNGSYPVTVSCNGNDVFDFNCNPVDISVENGSVIVK